MLRLNPSIDRARSGWFARLETLPEYEQQAVEEAVKCGIRTDTVAEIPDVLLAIDPVLAALWGQWHETLGIEAWAAVLKLTFAKAELLTAAQTGDRE